MKVITWNVNSVASRLERLLALLEKESPDIVCLQELKCLTENFPYEPIFALGYHSAVFGQKSYNGVAILSKEKTQNIQYGFGDGSEDLSARFITALVGKVWVHSAYIPNGQEVGSDKYAYKLDWLKRLNHYFQKRSMTAENILVCGDFNIAPEDKDVSDPETWKGKILCSGRERNALSAFCDLGFSDTFRLHHSEEGYYSWWDYRQLAFIKNNGLRIDFIFANSHLLKYCTKAWINRNERKGEKPSDHAPVIAEFLGF